MATVKLTTGLREQITRKVLHHRFQEEYEKLIAKGAKVADKVYNDVFSKKERDLMATLPEGWLPTDDDISIQTNEGYRRLNFNGSFYLEGFQRSNTVEMRRFPKSRMSGAAKVYDAGDKLGEEINKLEEAKKDLEARIANTKRQVQAALNSVTTLGKLKTEWPEIAPFCPELEAGSNLPAIPTNKLNELLNLPAEEAA